MHRFAVVVRRILTRFQGRTLDHRNVVSGKVVSAQKLPDLQLHQLQKLLVVDLIHLVQENHDVRNVYLTRQKNVLPRLRHRTVRRAHHQHRTVHLRRARDHVLHVVRVTRTVHVSVVTIVRLVLHVRRRNRDPTLPLLRSLVDLVERSRRRQILERLARRDRRRQRGLAMVHVTDRPHVYVRLRPLELLLRHGSFVLPSFPVPCCGFRLSFEPLELTSGFEPLTSSLPRTCSTY